MAALPEPDFENAEQVLRDAGSPAEAAEIHGEFCGLACVMGADAGPAWAAGVMADAQQGEPVRDMLQALATASWQELDAGEMGLVLLLPADNAPLEQRAEALGLWCQGFIHGLGVSSDPDDQKSVLKDELTREIITDFSQISRAAFADDETEAEGEAAYIELVEFVRVSVQLLFEELHPLRAGAERSKQH